MAELNWREVFAVSSLVLALLLIGGSIYLHVQQKHHFGRMHHESSASGGSGVDAAVVMTSQPYQPPPPASLPSSTHSELDDIDAIARVTPRNRYSEDDLPSGSGSGDNDSDDRSDYYEESGKYERFLEKRVNAFMPSIADKSTFDSKAVGDLRESAADDSSTTSANVASSVTATDGSSSSRHITEACLQCVWETVALCRPASCNLDVPGKISHPYWLDGGKLKLEGDHSRSGEKDEGYANCVNNVYCAGRTISAFVRKYARDCNQDGIVDCRDHIALHILGPSGCLTTELPSVFESRMEACLAKFEGQEEVKGR